MRSHLDEWKPESSAEIPQPFSIKMLKDYLGTYDKQKKRACLLHGPAGTGKTSSVYAVAKELGFEVIEVNSSDVRNKAQIQEVVGQAAFQQSLVASSKLLLIDEVDGIAGNADRGGVQALAKIIAATPHPIIMTANKAFDKKLKSLRSKSLMIEYKEIPTTNIKAILQGICQKHGIQHDQVALHTLARTSNGDLRGALQDLASLAEVSSKHLEGLDARDKEATFNEALTTLFQGKPEQAKEAFDKTNEMPDEWMLWIDENMAAQYSITEKAAAYECLSKADVYKGRIMRMQHWRFLAYIVELITTGVSAAKAGPKDYARYKQPGRILSMWINKMKYAKRDAILKKMAEKMHCSVAKAKKEAPYLLHIMKQKKLIPAVVEELNLEDDHAAWLAKA
ncbi:MAG: replication factor C large subunit [Candidatus Woesearchaeota archaeon]|nr:replication factor C large subunit [Candidatus Woesearchaeota archaeon]MDP7199131.1 replication factor C large subunit [Candidatus Woesearchaeota archaeon]MDP7467607.1 replication factor C large subunit [Candidatus Woesearchaeota archaeon]MDP7647089.1 replication factor C large subunit [Candidatus Woesearchaeota archaeon]